MYIYIYILYLFIIYIFSFYIHTYNNHYNQKLPHIYVIKKWMANNYFLS